MSVTPEQLAAYADGQLDAVDARAVEQELAQSSELQSQLAAHQALKARLAAHFAPVADEPVPDRLLQLLQGNSSPDAASDNVINLTAARMAPRPASAPSRPWARYLGPALAASLILAVVGIGLRPSGNYAKGPLADALDSQLAAEQSGDTPVRVLISFRDKAGAFCRGYAEEGGSAIACRDERGWKIRQRFDAKAAQSGEYRQAGSGAEPLLAAAQDLAAGAALGDDEERAARAHGWRRTPR